MLEIKISVEENPAPADLDVIESALVKHNEAKSEPRNYRSLTLLLAPFKNSVIPTASIALLS